jgi:hypothetical protein
MNRLTKFEKAVGVAVATATLVGMVVTGVQAATRTAVDSMDLETRSAHAASVDSARREAQQGDSAILQEIKRLREQQAETRQWTMCNYFHVTPQDCAAFTPPER